MQSILMAWARSIAVVVLLGACSADPTFTVEELQDPNTCMQCHPSHFDEWSSSMHAYASDDPVFVAMNKRGQRETGNQLGTFCVQCHAPMAVALHETDGVSFDPAALRPATKGITCYFCHSITDITDSHNNGLTVDLANTTMHGGAESPIANRAHHADYQARMDSDRNDSALCGACHDVVTPRGVPLERTFSEWQSTIFADRSYPPNFRPCGVCHMPSHDDVIADDPSAHVISRPGGYHEHLWPGVDQAMTPWPNTQHMADRIAFDFKPSVGIKSPTKGDHTAVGGICLPPTGVLTVRIDTNNLGHAWPSGAAQDRRAWLEVKAYDASSQLLFSSGVVADGEDPVFANLFGLWDQTFTDEAKTIPAHFFWDVVSHDSTSLLRPPVTTDTTDPRIDHSSTASFNFAGFAAQVDRIEVRLLIRAFAFDVLDQLIASGDLDPAFRAKVPTIELGGTVRTWTRATIDPLSYCNPF